MQQYFIKGQVENPVIIKDKDTVKHMFNVMRLTEDDQVVLVFEDGIKRLARVTDRENHIFEVIEDLNDNVEMPVSVTIASGFPKGDKLGHKRQQSLELRLSGPSLPTGLWSSGMVRSLPRRKISLPRLLWELQNNPSVIVFQKLDCSRRRWNFYQN